MSDKQTKTCPKCGNKFECHSESDCWCEKVQLPQKNMKYVLMNYDGCICPDCLNNEAKRVL